MTAADGLVFLLVCDNTLLDNDRVIGDLEQRYPARHYVMVDDKLRILAAMKKVWGERLTTVFPRQGHHALDPWNSAAYRLADITINCIGELISVEFPALPGTHPVGRTQQEAS